MKKYKRHIKVVKDGHMEEKKKFFVGAKNLQEVTRKDVIFVTLSYVSFREFFIYK